MCLSLVSLFFCPSPISPLLSNVFFFCGLDVHAFLTAVLLHTFFSFCSTSSIVSVHKRLHPRKRILWRNAKRLVLLSLSVHRREEYKRRIASHNFSSLHKLLFFSFTVCFSYLLDRLAYTRRRPLFPLVFYFHSVCFHVVLVSWCFGCSWKECFSFSALLRYT